MELESEADVDGKPTLAIGVQMAERLLGRVLYR